MTAERFGCPKQGGGGNGESANPFPRKGVRTFPRGLQNASPGERGASRSRASREAKVILGLENAFRREAKRILKSRNAFRREAKRVLKLRNAFRRGLGGALGFKNVFFFGPLSGGVVVVAVAAVVGEPPPPRLNLI